MQVNMEIVIVLQSITIILLSLLYKNSLSKKVEVKEEPLSKSELEQAYQDIYDSINDAIKNNQSLLKINVEHIGPDDFIPLYRGLKNHYPDLSMQLRHDHEKQYEYLLFDTGNYQGPRNKPLTIKLWEENHKIAPMRSYQRPPAPKRTIQSNPVPENNVFNMADYRRRR